MRHLFITGTMRSGTTLVEKLVASHPRASILSQPFPLLLVELKRRFLAHRGEDPGAYPLGDLFLETRYRECEWLRYVSGLEISRDELREFVVESSNYSGQYENFSRDRLLDVVGVAPSGVVAILLHLWEQLGTRDDISVAGAKEISCEEYLAALEDGGADTLVVLRDPRDIVASLTTGRSAEYAGRMRPLLFTIRQWRKSVAFALDRSTNRHSLRYEDVVATPIEALSGLLSDCGIPADLIDPSGLRDSNGSAWTGNSSYGDRFGVDAASIGSFQLVLPRDVARFVEASCLPEMRCAGYRSAMSVDEAIGVISSFEDPYPIQRPALAALVSKEARDEEIERLERLRMESSTDADEIRWFVNRTAARSLRRVL